MSESATLLETALTIWGPDWQMCPTLWMAGLSLLALTVVGLWQIVCLIITVVSDALWKRKWNRAHAQAARMERIRESDETVANLLNDWRKIVAEWRRERDAWHGDSWKED